MVEVLVQSLRVKKNNNVTHDEAEKTAKKISVVVHIEIH
jgi:hypothetical protein